MRTPIECMNQECGMQIGYILDDHKNPPEYPPEEEYFHEDQVVFGYKGVYCSVKCLEESNDT